MHKEKKCRIESGEECHYHPDLPKHKKIMDNFNTETHISNAVSGGRRRRLSGPLELIWPKETFRPSVITDGLMISILKCVSPASPAVVKTPVKTVFTSIRRCARTVLTTKALHSNPQLLWVGSEGLHQVMSLMRRSWKRKRRIRRRRWGTSTKCYINIYVFHYQMLKCMKLYEITYINKIGSKSGRTWWSSKKMRKKKEGGKRKSRWQTGEKLHCREEDRGSSEEKIKET